MISVSHLTENEDLGTMKQKRADFCLSDSSAKVKASRYGFRGGALIRLTRLTTSVQVEPLSS